MHLSMFYVLSILYQHYMYVHLHGAICLEIFVCLVVSSLPVGGLGMLQNVSKIFMSMLAYGWVERCINVAGCRMNSF